MNEPANTKHSIRIFFVSNSCWSIYNFRSDVLEHFIKLGYEVHVAALKDDFAIKLLNIGCKVHDIKFNNRRLNPLADIRFLLRLKALYRKVKPDLIFHYVIKPNIYGSIAASQLKIPSVAIITGLGYAFAKNNWLTTLVIKLYRYALKKAAFVWMLNEEDRQLFIQKKIVDIHKTDVLPSEGVNTQKFKSYPVEKNNETFVFFMATRMLWAKGVGLFAIASEILKQKGYTFECKVIGFFEPNHPDSIPIEQLEEWRSRGIFAFLGFSDDVVPHFAAADCFVLPSYYQEGVPRSLLEAGAMQLPVITTDNNGCNEVIKHNINGFICGKNNAEDLASKMEKILSLTHSQLAEMGCRGREIVLNKFDVKFTIEKYDHAVNSIISANK
jgi:glycosyltransferase involved in cell wall biosynthesis